MKISVTSLDAKDAGSVQLQESVFGLPVRKDILHRVVEWQRAKKQAGTHKTKTISEVSGTTAKAYKQKGTGNARHGSRRATQFVGGQTAFGPVVRSHAHKLNKKFRALGLKTALSAKYTDNAIRVIDSFDVSDISTASMVKSINALALKKPLFVDVAPSEMFVKSARNIKDTNILPAKALNVLDILKHKELVLTKEALKSIEERLA
jgi:large subunit ribosomal protein L4